MSLAPSSLFWDSFIPISQAPSLRPLGPGEPSRISCVYPSNYSLGQLVPHLHHPAQWPGSQWSATQETLLIPSRSSSWAHKLKRICGSNILLGRRHQASCVSCAPARQTFTERQEPGSGFRGGSDGKESACGAGAAGSTPGLERPPGEGNRNRGERQGQLRHWTSGPLGLAKE